MNRQVVPSMILSVFFVCFFSVLLYDREKPRSAVAPSGAEKRREPSPSPEPAGANAATAEKGSAASAPEASSPGVAASASASLASPPESSGTAAASAPVVPTASSEAPKTASPAAPAVPPEPRTAFTTARDGESLDDIALRVYGSTDQADALWRANRDLLPRRDSPIAAGAALRTPAE